MAKKMFPIFEIASLKRNREDDSEEEDRPTMINLISDDEDEGPVTAITLISDDEGDEPKPNYAAAYFKKYENRGALHHGSKEIPGGKPNCLKGYQFVISGILESMLRDEAVDLIKSCGGAVVSKLSKKVTHMLVGEEAGPVKIAKATEMRIAQISEDELLTLIRRESGLPEPSAVEPPKSPAPAKKEEKKTQAMPTVAQQPRANPAPQHMNDADDDEPEPFFAISDKPSQFESADESDDEFDDEGTSTLTNAQMVAAAFKTLKDKGIPANLITIWPEVNRSFRGKITRRQAAQAKAGLKERYEKYKRELEFGPPMSFEDHVVTSCRRPAKPTSTSSKSVKEFRDGRIAQGKCVGSSKCHRPPIEGQQSCIYHAKEIATNCRRETRVYSPACIMEIYTKVIKEMPDSIVRRYRVMHLNNPCHSHFVHIIIDEGRKGVEDLKVFVDGNGTKDYVGIATKDQLLVRMARHRCDGTMGTRDFNMNSVLLPTMYHAAVAEAMMAYDLVKDLNRDGKVICINKVSALGKMGRLADEKKVEQAYIYLLQVVPKTSV